VRIRKQEGKKEGKKEKGIATVETKEKNK